MEQCTNASEVARILNQIEHEYVAATRGLTGFAEGASHQAITARMEHMGQLHDDLRTLIGDEATRLMIERLETIPDEKERRPE